MNKNLSLLGCGENIDGRKISELIKKTKIDVLN